MVAQIPSTAAQRVAVHVTPAAERALRRGHPWIFDQAIRRQNREGSVGDLAVVFDRQRRFLAVGLYDPYSSIRVRILQQGERATIDRDWFQARLTTATQLRNPLQKDDTTGYRLVHGENDGLPGLVLDRYDETLVLKLYTLAWIPHLHNLLAAIANVIPTERLVLRLGRAMQEQPQHLYNLSDGTILFGPAFDGPVIFRENGLRFEADPIHGQKTGFFLDQRENRARVEKLATGKTVLNVFAYTGGFSLYAARGGARAIVDVDVSRPALDAAARNLALNRDYPSVAAVADKYERLAEDAFEALARLGRNRRFDLVIIDPPAFAKKRAEVERALSAYQRLTRLGLGVLQSGGTLVMASCSSRVAADEFFSAVHRAAVQARRPLREIERTGHPLDHPITFKEGAYLKCLFATAP
ncbi:MAG: class I SAM-dependent rRNA methyltransferase [Chloroflexi bacterium]|nr:class I SAM-dependent rRNA methyltransferase [Chloroflexota bacterium]